MWNTLSDESRAVLIWIGLIFQVLGLVVTGIGVHRTWREFADEPFLDPVVQPARRLWARVVAGLRRVFRRAQTLRVEGVLEAEEAGDSMLATGRVGFRIIPEDRPIADAITELDERTRHLLDQIGDTRRHHDEDLGKFGSDLDSFRDEASRSIRALGESDRRVAVSGLRWEASGLFLIALGVLLQGVGSAFQ